MQKKIMKTNVLLFIKVYFVRITNYILHPTYFSLQKQTTGRILRHCFVTKPRRIQSSIDVAAQRNLN